MENNKREDMVFVSFDRLWDNFKKFWWIAVLLMAVMLVYGAATYQQALATSEKKEDDVTPDPVVISENVEERLHRGTLSINFNVDIDTFQKSTGVVIDASASWDTYQQLCLGVITYANSIVTSQSFYEEVNAALVEAGYSEMITSARYGGDEEYDRFLVTYVSDRDFSFEYRGLGGPERIQYGTDVAAKILAERLMEVCDYVECEVGAGAEVELMVKIFGNYTGFAPTEDTVAALREQYSSFNQTVSEEIPKYSFSVSALFKVSTIIKGVVGFVIGLFIIFVIAVCDKKVRTREELERFFEGEGQFLGEIRRKDAVSEEVTAVSIAQMCAGRKISRLLLTTVGEQKDARVLESLAEKITNDQVKAERADGIEVAPQTSRAVAEADGTVILINGGADDVHTIKNALSRINTVQGNLAGYILYK